MTSDEMRQRLASILKAESIRKGDFVLASGRRSSYYLDCRRTTLHPEGAWLVGNLVFEAIERRGWKPAGVGGLTIGADPMATAAAIASFLKERPIGAFLVRKEAKAHGTGQQIEGAPPQGSQVVLVEDVITTGGSTRIARDACVAAGLQVLGVVALVDREEGGRDALEAEGLVIVPLFTAKELL